MYIKLRCSLFSCIIFKMKSLSNMIPFDFGLKIKFDRDFMVKMMPKKSEHLRGICTSVCTCVGVGVGG